MKRRALIVYDSWFGHRRRTKELRKYLSSVDVDVEICPVIGPVFQKLEEVMSQQGEDGLLLLVYIGHGGKDGWSGTWEQPAVPYIRLSELLGKAGPLMVINDTCYGLRLLSALKETRTEGNTSFLSPFGSRGVTFGAVVSNMLNHWPHGEILEDHVSGVICLRHDGSEHEYSPQARWGTLYDQQFFGTMPKRVLTRGEPIELGSIRSSQN